MKIPEPIVDRNFCGLVTRLEMEMNYQMDKNLIGSIHSRTPYYIFEILEECIQKGEIRFIEYIMYLNLCKHYNILRFWTKKEKNIIIQKVKEKYNKELDLQELKNYLNKSLKILAQELGYELEFKKDRYDRYAIRLKEEMQEKILYGRVIECERLISQGINSKVFGGYDYFIALEIEGIGIEKYSSEDMYLQCKGKKNIKIYRYESKYYDLKQAVEEV